MIRETAQRVTASATSDSCSGQHKSETPGARGTYGVGLCIVGGGRNRHPRQAVLLLEGPEIGPLGGGNVLLEVGTDLFDVGQTEMRHLEFTGRPGVVGPLVRDDVAIHGKELGGVNGQLVGADVLCQPQSPHGNLGF